MATEYIVSTTMYFWGDQLTPRTLIDQMGLDPKFCYSRVLGEEIIYKSGVKRSRFVKTGTLGFEYIKQFPDDSRDSDKQFNFILEKLKEIKGKLYEDFNVDKAELHLSIYYGDLFRPDDGVFECEFLIPSDLQKELTKLNIGIMFMAIP